MTTENIHPENSKGEPGFLHKYSSRIIVPTLTAIVVGGLSWGILYIKYSDYERSRPVQLEHYKQGLNKVTSSMEPTTPLKILPANAERYLENLVLYGRVTKDRYLEVRNKAFEIAGIDENNPKDNEKRFKLYRQLGFAVRKTDNNGFGIHIPYSAWKDFVERNSSEKVPMLSEIGATKRYTDLGHFLFDADSKSNKGNENGFVNDKEWLNALRQEGYTTIEDIVKQTMRGSRMNISREGLKSLLRDTHINHALIIDDLDQVPNLRKLE
ncbi:hypothetical protein HYW20_02620 [Candidatus Woesearchaeota archaeon]|nr:hypothetical protein [Candidatus Woesearchaeota archaeon]